MVVVDGLGFTMMGEKVGEDCKLKNKKQVLDGLHSAFFAPHLMIPLKHQASQV
jgi:hypothetical protein